MRYATWVLAAITLTIPLLYVAAYLAIVRTTLDGGLSYKCWSADPEDMRCAPYYAVEGELSEILFYPLHLVDRTLRPRYWLIPSDPQHGAGSS